MLHLTIYNLKYFIVFYRKMSFSISYPFFIITFLAVNYIIIICRYIDSLYNNITAKLWTTCVDIKHFTTCILYITNNYIFKKVILTFKRKNKAILSFTPITRRF